MSTVATATLKSLAEEWRKLYPSAKISGIVGDKAHAARGGYHMSRDDNPKGNYSIVRPDDQYGQKDAAAAIDMTMNSADMIVCAKRLATAYANIQDPRRKYLNAVNGWDGSGAATRFDFYARKTSVASADHKWHVHLEIRRKYVNSRVAAKAILSILVGETVAGYLASIGVTSPTATTTATVKKVVTPPPFPGKVFRRDDNMKPDSDLAKWQRRMIERGYKSLGTADGRFGPKTESVVRKFQAVCKVAVDGEIGRQTWPLPWSRPLGS